VNRASILLAASAWHEVLRAATAAASRSDLCFLPVPQFSSDRPLLTSPSTLQILARLPRPLQQPQGQAAREKVRTLLLLFGTAVVPHPLPHAACRLSAHAPSLGHLPNMKLAVPHCMFAGADCTMLSTAKARALLDKAISCLAAIEAQADADHAAVKTHLKQLSSTMRQVDKGFASPHSTWQKLLKVCAQSSRTMAVGIRCVCMNDSGSAASTCHFNHPINESCCCVCVCTFSCRCPPLCWQHVAA
jgi:hypothetical protein